MATCRQPPQAGGRSRRGWNDSCDLRCGSAFLGPFLEPSVPVHLIDDAYVANGNNGSDDETGDDDTDKGSGDETDTDTDDDDIDKVSGGDSGADTNGRLARSPADHGYRYRS